MPDGLGWIGPELERLERDGLRRRPPSLSSPPGPEVVIGGRRVIQLCSNDYLGLAGDPRLAQAAAEAAHRWGAGSGASRLVSGTTDLHRGLEEALARHKGCEDAALFSSGYLANVGTIAALVGRGDAVFSDELNHASIVDGCRLSGARVVVFGHADAADLEGRLAATPARRRLLVTDTIFSMEGDRAPIEEIAEACRRHDAMLMVDDAHATGVLDPRLAGPGGSGAGVVMSTLSKALGSAGGFVAGSRDLVEWLRNRARTYGFDTAPAPAAVAAAATALRIAEAEPERARGVLAAARELAAGLRSLGYTVREPAAAIVPVVVGEATHAMALSARLLDAGVFVPAIRPPSVPAGTARLRVTVTATHTADHLAAALEAFAAVRPAARPAGRRAAPPATPGVDERILRAGGVFVTGTGTGVGKTVVAAALARTLGAAGLAVAAMKPVQTGTAEGADDLAFIQAAAGLADTCCAAPYALAAPLAPSVAARLEGERVDASAIREAFAALRRDGGAAAVIVEGAGGLLVPVDATTTMADLAGTLALPVLVVARPGLGMLNETALTVEAATRRGLAVVGVVICRYPAHPGLAEATNPAEMERLAAVPLVGVVPELEGLDVDRRRVPFRFDAGPWLAPALGGTFDRPAFLRTCEPARCLPRRSARRDAADPPVVTTKRFARRTF